MIRSKLLIPAISAFALPALSLAQDDSAVYDRVDLSASAETQIESDLLVAVVFAEVEANRQDDAASQVNEAIQWAVDKADSTGDFELQTARYSTRPIYTTSGRSITGWVARQSLQIESTDAPALSELLGTLQNDGRVAIQSLNSMLSKPARDRAEEALIAEALASFNRRAELIARELGRDGFRIVRLSVSAGRNFAELQRAPGFFSADAMAAAEPAIETGTQSVTVTVGGTIERAAGRGGAIQRPQR